MIDKNGKLFGKINIIDFVVVLVLIAAVAVLGVAKFSQSSSTAANQQTEFTMEFSADEVYDFVLEHIKEGEPIYDVEKEVNMGVVTSLETAPSRAYYADSEGRAVMSEKEGFSSIKITGKMNGQLTPLGAVIDGETYGVGHTITIRAGKAKIYMKVSDIK